MCDPVRMDDDLARISAAYRRAKTKADELYEQLRDAVIEQYKAGVGTMDIARRTGQDRELIRRMRVAAERAGVLPKKVER